MASRKRAKKRVNKEVDKGEVEGLVELGEAENKGDKGDKGDKGELGVQAIEGYACTCGFKTPDLSEFRKHLYHAVKEEGHKSLGRVNFETGEIIMPPASERTPEQWKEARYGRNMEKTVKSEKPKSTSKPGGAKPIEVAASAMQLRFTPRVYTIDYSPIIRIAQNAAIKYWGWRTDMPLGNFLDTVIFLYFKEKGITLAGYIIEETDEEKTQRETAVASYKPKQEVAA